MKKKLVFYFYITPDFFEHTTNLIHLECLRRYAHIFDDALFVLSTDNINDTLVLSKVRNILINFMFKGNIAFKIHKNDEFRESIVLKEEVFDKIKEENALVFFGHGKGFTNIGTYNEEDIFHWIVGSYYLSLNFIDEVERNINNDNSSWVTYGSFLIQNSPKRNITEVFQDMSPASYIGTIKYQWIYSGTFFWINAPKLKQIIKNFDIELPSLNDRFYSEKFLGNIIPVEHYATGHNNMILFGQGNYSMYDPNVSREFIGFISHTKEEYEKYMSTYDSIMRYVHRKQEGTKLIEIVYVATNGYCNYAKGFFDSLKYFMPGVKKKVTVLSNKMDEYDGYTDEDIINTEVIHMFDLIYPCVNLHKNYFLEQMKHKDVDYIFYFDADTIFKEVPDYDWNKMLEDMDKGMVIISKHPVYALKKDGKIANTSKQDWIANFFTSNVTEKDSSRRSYISYPEYTYVISSFFAANINTMQLLNKKIIEMTREDLTRYYGYHIPQFIDENYFNSLTSDYENGVSHGIDFSIKQYSELYNSENDTIDTVFLYQKNLPDFKTNRR